MKYIIFTIELLILSKLIINFIKNQDKKAWRNNPKIHLDEHIQNFNDESRKEIDGPYYVEGKYWVLENSHTYTNWYCYSSNKSIIRFAARLFIARGCFGCRVFSSN